MVEERILPLYHFFERLRQNEFQLGIGEYENFITALQSRMGLNIDGYTAMVNTLNERVSGDPVGEFPKEQLLRLVKLLWLKPGQSMQVFEELYEECVPMDFPERARPVEKKPELIDPNLGKDNELNKQNETNAPVVLPEEKEQQLPVNQNTETNTSPVPLRVALQTAESELLLGLQQSAGTETSKFLFTNNYYPIDRRKAQQNLKRISSVGYGQPSPDIDIDATIQKTLTQGFFTEPVFKKLKINTTSLLLLIDGHGSMTAFEQLTANIKSEAEEALMPNKKIASNTMKTYYFYNVPGDFLYTNQTHTGYEISEKVLCRLKSRSSGVIIISDAGAARGRLSAYRIRVTKAFLKRLHNYTNRVAWLNPLPKERWVGNSAGEIAKYVAMSEANESGIKNAIDFLKGSSGILLKEL